MQPNRWVVFFVVALLAVVLLMSAGPMSASTPRWEYGIYERVQPSLGQGRPTFHWQTRDIAIRVENEKFRLFKKLGINATSQTAHEIVLWNYLGEQGWEFVEYYEKISGQNLRKATIFRRMLN